MQFSKVKGVKIQFPNLQPTVPRVSHGLVAFLADFDQSRTNPSRTGRAWDSILLSGRRVASTREWGASRRWWPADLSVCVSCWRRHYVSVGRSNGRAPRGGGWCRSGLGRVGRTDLGCAAGLPKWAGPRLVWAWPNSGPIPGPFGLLLLAKMPFFFAFLNFFLISFVFFL